MRILVACAALCALLTSFVQAQPSTGQTVLVNEGGFYGNSIIAMGRFGIISTVLPLPAGPVGGVTVNQIGNEDIATVGTMILGVNNGIVRTITASLAAPAQDIIVDEDNTYVMAAGSVVLGLNPVAGTRTTLATGFGNASQVCYFGTTGAILVLDNSDDKIWAVNRDGTKQVLATVPNARCMEWDRYNAEVFVAATNILYRMDATGGLTTLEQNKPGLIAPSGMFLRSDRTLMIVQNDLGTNTTGLYSYFGSNGRYNRPYHEDTSSATGINPRDVTVDHFRELAPIRTVTRVGGTHDFLVNFPRFAGRTFVAALSFSHAPGIPVGHHRLHLNLDPLMMVSLTTPSLFRNFGTLGQHGTARVTLFVPDIAGLAGARIFMAAIVLDQNFPNGVAETSNPLGITIQPKLGS